MAEKKRKLPADSNQRAKSIVEMATDEERTEPASEKNPAAVELGGLKGRKARAKALSPEKRKEIAKKAAEARWKDPE